MKDQKKNKDGFFVYSESGFAIKHNCEDFIFGLRDFADMQILEFSSRPTQDNRLDFDLTRSVSENNPGEEPHRVLCLVGDYVFMFRISEITKYIFYFCHKDFFTDSVRTAFLSDDYSQSNRLRNPNNEMESTALFGLNCKSFLNEPCFDTWSKQWIYPENPNKVEIFAGSIIQKNISIEDLLSLPVELFILCTSNYQAHTHLKFNFQAQAILGLATNQNGIREALKKYILEANELRKAFGMDLFNYNKTLTCSLSDIEFFRKADPNGFGTKPFGFPSIADFLE
jgi:hypothetical protein